MNGYEVFVKQMGGLLENDRKRIKEDLEKSLKGKGKEEAKKAERIAAAQEKNVVAIANSYAVYVRDECKRNPDFNRQVMADWKSAPRMLKFVRNRAQEIAFDGMAMVADHCVYDWVNEYYFLDDKEEVYEQRRKEAEAKAKAEAEAKAKAERKAKSKAEAEALLSKDEAYQNSTEEEKKKLLNKKVNELVAKAEKSAKAKEKREAKAKAERDEAIKALESEASFNSADDKEKEKLIKAKIKEIKASKKKKKSEPVQPSPEAKARENIAASAEAMANVESIRQEAKLPETKEFQQMSMTDVIMG